MKINEFTITQAHRGLVDKEFSCEELTRACFERIIESDETINAFVDLNEDAAYESAREIDEKIKQGEKIGFLEGIPFALKDNILVEGLRATAGSKMLSDYVAPFSATVAARLKDLGSVLVGKTNMDEFAMGSSGETSYFGATKNPIDLTKVTGGSSSGSAAAIANNDVIYALGSDTGGSVRQPASFCGVVGFKPSYGRISRHGLMAMASSFDQIGTITKSVRDAALVFESIAGKDDFDATCLDKKAEVMPTLDQEIKGLKIGVPKEFFIEGMDKEVAAAISAEIKKLSELGAEIIEISLPKTKYALAVYYILMTAEVSSNMARYDGVRYGFRAKSDNLSEMYLKSRGMGFGDEVRRRIMLGTYVLSSGYYDAYYKKAQQARRLIKQDFDNAFEKVDCLVTPTTPTKAFSLGEKFDDPMKMYLADIFTVSASVAGLPAICLPCGNDKKSPVGLQLLSKNFNEAVVLQVANNLEEKNRAQELR
ncbi:Asp-tRNA(Asn)/Glu-tRNA(Gln) amidotransferase subunit GatA [Patescibacteria group bacterium]|nr:Asp-tRNA(Asn)/Glu-tRNA(Gln) amidotransferase subunit GatA [Patescibacteria group bacterium]